MVTKREDIEKSNGRVSEVEPTQAQIGFHNICRAIRSAKPPPMSIQEFELWSAPVMDALNNEAELSLDAK